MLKHTKIIMLACALALAAAGCGEKDPGPMGVGLNAGASVAQQKQDYEDAQERMRSTVEDPSAPPLDQAISSANRKQLTQAAQRWDQAVAIAKSVTPPKEIAAAHTDLVGAMEGLGAWNRKIASAAPDRRKTKQLARQARKSGEAKRFQAAIEALETNGYVTFVSASDEPMDAASEPVG